MITGDVDGGSFGYSMAAADVSADGFADVLVGDSSLVGDSGAREGAAYLFLGGGG